MVGYSSANPKVPVRLRARSHTRVMDYNETCFMSSGVVHNFPKAVRFLSPMHSNIPGNSGLSSQQ